MRLWALVRHRTVKKVLRHLIRAARVLTPVREYVVVYGWPQDEGNSVELVRHLGSLGIPVRWLLDDAPGPAVQDVLGSCPSVLARRRLSLRGFTDFLNARLTFFTHGLFLSAASPRRKTVVNLWHGDGPKRNFMPNGEPPPRCHYVVSCSSVFGSAKAEFFGVPEEGLLVTGNPRNDRLFCQPGPEKLENLGLRHGRFVVYMPTYRSARALGTTVAWQDGSNEADLRGEALSQLVEAARQVGLDVVVKPHPLDAIGLAGRGAFVLGDEALAAVGLNSYELLAASHSLVTDYSSIWTDYLSTGKHVAFAVPDWEAYAATRGLDQSIDRAALPGPVARTTADFLDFFRAIETRDFALTEQRDHAVKTFGLVTSPGNSRRLVDALAERGVRLPTGTPS